MPRFHAVQTQLETVRSRRRGGQRVRPRDFLAFNQVGERCELAGNKIEAIHPDGFESEMPDTRRDLVRFDQPRFHRFFNLTPGARDPAAHPPWPDADPAEASLRFPPPDGLFSLFQSTAVNRAASATRA